MLKTKNFHLDVHYQSHMFVQATTIITTNSIYLFGSMEHQHHCGANGSIIILTIIIIMIKGKNKQQPILIKNRFPINTNSSLLWALKRSNSVVAGRFSSSSINNYNPTIFQCFHCIMSNDA